MYIRIFKCYQYVNNYYLITNTDQICNTITIMGSIVSGICLKKYTSAVFMIKYQYISKLIIR